MTTHSPTPSAPAPRSTVELPAAIRSFLEPAHHATIATLDADGAPHLAFVWYLLDGDDIVLNSRTERHWPRNLQRDPRVHFGVRDEADDDDHWVGVKGRAEVLRDGDAALEDIMAMARRYGGNPDKFRGQSRISFVIRPESTFEYGG
jgi:PPOX class probable F420-dependent enzyme